MPSGSQPDDSRFYRPPSDQVDDALDAFTEAMRVRLREKLPAWGLSWRDGTYNNKKVLARLRRAVDHLEAAMQLTTPDRETQVIKRAADVANQALMAADRLR